MEHPTDSPGSSTDCHARYTPTKRDSAELDGYSSSSTLSSPSSSFYSASSDDEDEDVDPIPELAQTNEEKRPKNKRPKLVLHLNVKKNRSKTTQHPANDTNSLTSGNCTSQERHANKGGALDTLRNMWETAFIVAFTAAFHKFLPEGLGTIDATALESALVGPMGDDQVDVEAIVIGEESIGKLHCAFLTNMLNRKQRIEHKSQNWIRLLSETIDAKMKTGSFERRYNPLKRSNYEYSDMDVVDKVIILKSLCEWQLVDCVAIHSYLDQESKNVRKGKGSSNGVIGGAGAVGPLTAEPIGVDASNRSYWYFGKGSTRVYRSMAPTKTVPKKKTKQPTWEAVTSTLDDLQLLAGELMSAATNTKTGKERNKLIATMILEDILPCAEAAIQRKVRQARTRARMADLHTGIQIYESRTRNKNKPVQYNFGDEEPEVEGEDEYVYYEG